MRTRRSMFRLAAGLVTAILGVALAPATPAQAYLPWAGWTAVPGSPVVSKYAVAEINRILHIFATDNDGRILEMRQNGDTWGRWLEVPGGFRGSFVSATTYVGGYGAQGPLFVFARPSGGSGLSYNTFENGAWAGWREVTGDLQGGYVAGSTSGVTGPLRIFTSAIGPGIVTNEFVPASWAGPAYWTGWSQVPGGQVAYGGPAAAIDYTGAVNLIVRGYNGVRYTTVRNGQWSGWADIPGPATNSEPTAVTRHQEVWAFITGTNGVMYVNRRHSADWVGWTELPGGGRGADGPKAVYRSLGGRIQLIVKGLDGRLYSNVTR
jgi:hypothetical protein